MADSVKTKVAALVASLTEALTDAEKFSDNGNKAAGTRVRKALMEVSKECKAIRQQVSDEKNAE